MSLMNFFTDVCRCVLTFVALYMYGLSIYLIQNGAVGWKAIWYGFMLVVGLFIAFIYGWYASPEKIGGNHFD